MKRSLKGEDASSKSMKRGDSSDLYSGDMVMEMKSSQQKNQEEIEQSSLMQKVLQMYSDIKFTPFDYDLRVKDASYTVTNHVEAYEMSDAEKNKQHYDTVASSSFVAKFIRKCKHFVKKGKWRKQSETRVLLDGANLQFKSGKMYLVLGVSISCPTIMLANSSISIVLTCSLHITPN